MFFSSFNCVKSYALSLSKVVESSFVWLDTSVSKEGWFVPLLSQYITFDENGNVQFTDLWRSNDYILDESYKLT